MTSVIVFGPTGQIGSVAALTAAEHGARVWLAMRDTQKPIPGLTDDQEKAGGFQRVHADLQKPETVSEAVKTANAKHAFVYLAHGASDHMKATFEALKSAGIDFVVFLSSFTIHTDKGLRDIPASEMIPYLHAQCEATLDDVYGSDHYVAIRPGAFASNLLREQKGIVAGHVSLFGGEFQQDNTNPSDIGRVSGTVLASGPRHGQKKVYVYGPKQRSIHDSIVEIGRLLGKNIEITAVGPEEGLQNFISSGLPRPFAEYMVRVLESMGPEKGSGEIFPNYDEGVNNVELYTGKPSSTLEDWVNENKAVFST